MTAIFMNKLKNMDLINYIKHNIKIKAVDFNIIKPKISKQKAVLMYHGIDLEENKRYNTRFFSKKHFERHLIYYKKNYNIISLEDFIDNKNCVNDKLNIAITFDDGYRNNYLYAFPLLEKYQIPAHFFITGMNNSNINYKILWSDALEIASSVIDKPLNLFGKEFIKEKDKGFRSLKEYIKKYPISGTDAYIEFINVLNIESNNIFLNEKYHCYWELMTDEDIKNIYRSQFVKIGSHGFWHNNLASLSYKNACQEIEQSKKYLENITQYEINAIGYPDGSYTKEISSFAYQIGIKYQCAVEYKYKEDINNPNITDRIGLYPKASPKYLNYIINES